MHTILSHNLLEIVRPLMSRGFEVELRAVDRVPGYEVQHNCSALQQSSELLRLFCAIIYMRQHDVLHKHLQYHMCVREKKAKCMP